MRFASCGATFCEASRYSGVALVLHESLDNGGSGHTDGDER
jgi:hypothetical protein